MDLTSLKKDIYFSLYYNRNVISTGIFINLILFVISLYLDDFMFPQNGIWAKPMDDIFLIGSLPYILLSSLIILITIYLYFPAWFSVYFRYLALWTSSSLGKIYSVLKSGWRPWLLLLLVVSVIVWLRGLLIGDPYTQEEILMEEFLSNVLVLAAMIALLKWAYEMRDRIIIQEFKNYTGDDTLKHHAECISSTLLNELARLKKLYGTVDASTPYGLDQHMKRANEFSAPINVENVGASLKDAISSDSKISVGSIQIPIGTITGLISRAVEGPRLMGSLHKDGQRFILLAGLSGDKFRGKWKVTSDDLEERNLINGKTESDKEIISRMVSQLANRVFTDLEKDRIGTPRWKAVCCYTAGLRAYRDTLRTDRNKIVLLRKAEKYFIRAFSEDKDFLKCHYNLGVVYSDMALWDSALSELERSLKDDAGLSKSYLSGIYFAMATANYSLKNYNKAIKLCNQSITLQPNNPQSWNLMAVLIRKQEDSKKGKVAEDGKNICNLIEKICSNMGKSAQQDAKYAEFLEEEVTPVREISVALAWKRLCISFLRSVNNDSDKQIAFYSLRNLARVYSRTEKSLVKKLADQAIILEHNNADLYYFLGKNLREIDRPEEAINALETGLSIKPSHYLWSEIALTYAILFEKTSNKNFKEKSSHACENVLNNLCNICRSIKKSGYTSVDKEALCFSNVRRALKKIGEEGNEAKLLGLPNCKIEQVLRFIACLGQTDEKSFQKYQKWIDGEFSKKEEYNWIRAHILVELASNCLRIYEQENEKKQLDKAKEFFEEAIKIFREKNPEEIRCHEIHSGLAKVYKYLEEFNKSIYHSEQSVALDPEDTKTREMCSSIHLDCQNYELAKSHMEICYSLNPADSSLLEKIGYTRVGSAFGAASLNVEELKKAISDLELSIRHHESKPLEYGGSEENLWMRVRLYYNIGSRYIDLNDNGKAMSNFLIADRLASKISRLQEYLIIRHDLGHSYLNMKKYFECENRFFEIIKEIESPAADPAKEIPHDKTVGLNLGLSDVSKGHVYAYACISLACSYVERESNFIMALHLTEKAEGCINNMNESPRKTYLRSKCLDCRGLALYRGNRFGYWYDEIDKAIQCLESACSIYADAENYLHLATAFEYRLQKLKVKLQKTEIDNRNIEHFRNRALAYCDHASELDTQKKYKDSIEELKKRLEEKDSQENNEMKITQESK